MVGAFGVAESTGFRRRAALAPGRLHGVAPACFTTLLDGLTIRLDAASERPQGVTVGRYAARTCTLGLCSNEVGSFHAIPMNPAVGFAFLSLKPDGSSEPKSWIVHSIDRATDGTIDKIGVQRGPLPFATTLSRSATRCQGLPPS